MNILIIGNSHVGSLKRAYANISSELKDVKLHFVASRNDGLSSATVTDGILSSDNKRTAQDIEFTFGSSAVDINNLELNAILFYGVGLPFDFFQNSIQELYSKKFIEDCFNEFSRLWDFRLAIDLAEQTRVPTYVASPFRSREGVHSEVFSLDLYERLLEEITGFQERFLSKVKLNYVLQPIETFSPHCITFVEYSRGSKRLALKGLDDELHPISDHMHMNDLFGEIFLKFFLKKL